jgi:hypothetical protein
MTSRRIPLQQRRVTSWQPLAGGDLNHRYPRLGESAEHLVPASNVNSTALFGHTLGETSPRLKVSMVRDDRAERKAA